MRRKEVHLKLVTRLLNVIIKLLSVSQGLDTNAVTLTHTHTHTHTVSHPVVPPLKY